MVDLEKLYEAILTGKLEMAQKITDEAITENMDLHMIIDEYMSRAMGDIGKQFEQGKAFVPELLMAARAMKGSLELLKPHMQGSASHSLGQIIIGTVKGDLHDIGKNLVASMLEGCGFEVINLGINISAEQFVNALKEHQAQILCMSALLTTTMTYMREVIESLERNGLRDQVKIMIGGAPVSETFSRQIGADGYSDNANDAVLLAKSLLSV